MLVLGFRITTSPLAALAGFVLIIAFGIALSWVAALIGLSVRNPETAQSAGFIWMFPTPAAVHTHAVHEHWRQVSCRTQATESL